jgi:hypothetical protein
LVSTCSIQELAKMGCNGSKASVATPKDAAAPQNTLLDTPAAKPLDKSDTEPFPIFVDSIGSNSCLEATDDATMLKVKSVEGGVIGLWNNRPKTAKVKKGDLVVKVRKAGPSAGEWITNDAVLMLGTLQTVGPFEMVMKRETGKECEPGTKSEVLPVITEEVDPAAKDTADSAIEAPSQSLAPAPVETDKILEETADTAKETPPETLAPAPVAPDDDGTIEVVPSDVNKGHCGFFAC